MTIKWKQHSTLIIGILIPILMVLFIIGSIYLPRFLSDEVPEYDFLYRVGPSVVFQDGFRVEYFVKDGKLMQEREMVPEERQEEFFYRGTKESEMSFFRYDVSKKRAEEISFEEARTLTLDESEESPNGFEVSRSGHTIFFGDYDDSGYVLTGNYYHQELELEGLGDDYYRFQMLGWIIRE